MKQWKHIPDVEECRASEGEVTPLVVAVHERTNQAADDDDDAHEKGGHDV